MSTTITATPKLDLNKVALLVDQSPREGVFIGYFIINDASTPDEQKTIDDLKQESNDLSLIKEKATDPLPRHEKEYFLKNALRLKPEEMDFYCECEFVQSALLREDGQPLVYLTDCTIGATHSKYLQIVSDLAKQVFESDNEIVANISAIPAGNKRKHFIKMLQERGIHVGEPIGDSVKLMPQRVADAREAVSSGNIAQLFK